MKQTIVRDRDKRGRTITLKNVTSMKHVVQKERELTFRRSDRKYTGVGEEKGHEKIPGRGCV